MGDLLLGTDVATGESVYLDEPGQEQGFYVIGSPGRGKSTFVLNLIAHHIRSGAGVAVLDSHGELVDDVLKIIPRERRFDVILLDPRDEQYPFGLQLLESKRADPQNDDRPVQQLLQLVANLWGSSMSETPRLAQYLRNCAYTILANPGYTIAEMPLLLQDQTFCCKLLERVTSPSVRLFWQEYWDLGKNERHFRAESILDRLDSFLSSRRIRNIVGQSRSTINFRQCMDQGRIVLARLPTQELGEDNVKLLGGMIATLLLNAGLSRADQPEKERRFFHICADEYHLYATPAFGRAITELRKYKVTVTVVHQFREQLTDPDNRGATLAMVNQAIFGLGGVDAEEVVKNLDRTPPPPEIVGYKPKPSYARKIIEELSRGRHSEQEVRTLYEKYLSRFYYWAHQSGSGTSKLFSPSDPRPGLAKEVIDVLDSYFYEVMVGDVSYRSEQELVHLRRIFSLLGYWTMLAMRDNVTTDDRAIHIAHWDRPDSPETKKMLEEWLACYQKQDNSLQTYWRVLMANKPITKVAVWDHFHPYYPGWMIDPQDISIIAKLGGELPKQNPPPPKPVPNPSQEEIDQYVSLCQQKAARDYYFVRGLVRLAHLLQRFPLMTDSGQFEPIYASPRTYLDVEKEVATKLVKLDPYHAVVKIRQGHQIREYTIKTRKPPPPTGIGFRTPFRPAPPYTRYWQDVEAEMELRQIRGSAEVVTRPEPVQREVPSVKPASPQAPPPKVQPPSVPPPNLPRRAVPRRSP